MAGNTLLLSSINSYHSANISTRLCNVVKLILYCRNCYRATADGLIIFDNNLKYSDNTHTYIYIHIYIYIYIYTTNTFL